jgi:fructokinase
VEKSGNYSTEALNSEKFLAEKLNGLGAKIVALTDGARGAWGFDGEEFLRVEVKKEKIADTLGAGDAFASGFVAAQLKDKGLAECLYWGIANSSSVIKSYGGVAGLLRENEIKKIV